MNRTEWNGSERRERQRWNLDRGEYSTGFKLVAVEPQTLFRLQGLIDELVPFS